MNFKQRRKQKSLAKRFLEGYVPKKKEMEKESLKDFISEEFNIYNTVDNYRNNLNRKQRRKLGMKKLRSEGKNEKLAKGFGKKKFDENKFLNEQRINFEKGLMKWL